MKSTYVCTYPLTCMSLAVCRHAELGCTARLSEVTGLSQTVALTRPSVVWLNLQSSVDCYRVSGSGYPDLANCRRAHCCIKMVDGTDNHKNTEKETALCFTRYTQANI